SESLDLVENATQVLQPNAGDEDRLRRGKVQAAQIARGRQPRGETSPRTRETQFAFAAGLPRKPTVFPHRILHVRETGLLEHLALLWRNRRLAQDGLQVSACNDCGAALITLL